MNVIAKFVVGISRPHHPLCMQIIILTIQAKKINNNASGHENEEYQKNTHILLPKNFHSHYYNILRLLTFPSPENEKYQKNTHISVAVDGDMKRRR